MVPMFQPESRSDAGSRTHNLINGLSKLSRYVFGINLYQDDGFPNVLASLLKDHPDWAAFLEDAEAVELKTARARYFSKQLADDIPLHPKHKLFNELARAAERERSRIRRLLKKAPKRINEFMAENLPARFVPSEREIAEAILAVLKRSTCDALERAYVDLYLNHGIHDAETLGKILGISTDRVYSVKSSAVAKLRKAATPRETHERFTEHASHSKGPTPHDVRSN